MELIKNIIGNREINASGEYLNNWNPSTGVVYSQIAKSGKEDALLAIEAAEGAKKEWAKTTFSDRANLLKKLAQGIRNNFNQFVHAEVLDSGKTVLQARTVDIPRAAVNFEFFAEAVTQRPEMLFRNDEKIISQTRSEPLGVVATISPWNLPLYLLTWKVAPALAMGNTVIAKPSEITPMTAYLLGKLAVEVGFPPGVLNILQGEGPALGEILCTHPEIKAISFTGSTNTGRQINTMASGFFKKVSLEMGGKNPLIICEDAPLEFAVSSAVKSVFSNQGQICLCTSRIFVHSSIFEKFKKDLVKKVEKLVVGDPFSEKTDLGPLISQGHLKKVLSFVEKAKKTGTVIFEGQKNFNQGFFLGPTLFENLTNEDEVNQEEIFGPFATLIPFNSDEEALSMANDSRYGLCASVWTKNLIRANYFSSGLKVGMVWINTWMHRDLRTPFGGIKESGLGREGGHYALDFFSEKKMIATNYEGTL